MAGAYQRKDHLFCRAKDEGYRSRAAYKLIELNEKHRVIRSASTVLDLGCFPGGWLQVALGIVGRQGVVVGVDLQRVQPVSFGGASAVILQGDANEAGIRANLVEALARPVDVVLSDMSPALSGIRFRDAVRSAELVRGAFELACAVLRPGGSLIAKTFPGAESDQLLSLHRTRFRKVSRASLKSSRKTSNEFYFIAKEFFLG